MWTAGWCVLAAAQTVPQTDAHRDPVLRVSVTLVQIDAVVTDGKGNRISDLKAEDFEILQDGKMRPIKNFSWVDGTTAPANPVASGREIPPPGKGLRPEEVKRAVALVVDDLGLSFESISWVRDALRKFIDQQMQPGDLVAILRTSSGTGAMQQFTPDKRQLHAAIERMRFRAGSRGRTFPAVMESELMRQLDAHRDSQLAVGTVGALNYVVRGLRELPGRKAVLVFSDGFKLYRERPGMTRASAPPGSGPAMPPSRISATREVNTQLVDAMRRLTDQANRSAVVIHAIDARGLQTVVPHGADQAPTPDAADEFRETQDGLHYVARETGGLFFHDNNDLGAGVRQVLEDQRSYYLLGFDPGEAAFEMKGKEQQFHRLAVRVKRPGVRVRYRRGYYGVADRPVDARATTPAARMVAAMASPFGADGIRLRLTALFGHSPNEGSFIQSLLHLDGRDLTFSPNADGTQKAEVDVAVLAVGETGVMADQSGRTFTIRVRRDKLEALRQAGFTYMVNHPLKGPGPYQLRVAVRDHASERLGSASQYIEAPDMSNGHLALSGIILTSAQEEGAPAGPQPDPMGEASVRIFPPGKALQYVLQMFQAHPGRDGNADIESQIVLWRDGRAIHTGQPETSTPAMPAGGNPLLVAGTLRLSPKIAAGTYTLEVIVTDRMARDKKHAKASQWIDFEIQ